MRLFLNLPLFTPFIKPLLELHLCIRETASHWRLVNWQRWFRAGFSWYVWFIYVKLSTYFACFHGFHMDLVPPDLGAWGLVISASCRFYHLQGPPLWSVGPCFAFLVSPSPYGPPNWRGPYGDVLSRLLFSLRVSSIKGSLPGVWFRFGIIRRFWEMHSLHCRPFFHVIFDAYGVAALAIIWAWHCGQISY